MADSGPGKLPLELQRRLADIASTRMPFGKYGPENYPPVGILLIDLPYEYLAWFERKGFPRGRLGDMLKLVWQIKRDGAEALFDPFRDDPGERSSLRRKRQRRWRFSEAGEES